MTLLTAIAVASFLMAVILFFFLDFFSPKQQDKPSAPPPRFELSGMPTVAEGRRGDPHTCPVCAAKFERGESIKSKILPPSSSNDRLLHISGCAYCYYEGGRRRECPVCGVELSLSDYLVARIFTKIDKEKGEKSHVHVVGCPHCRGR